MLERADVATRLPAQDLSRAHDFYAQRLGLEPTEERPGGLLYRGAEGEFALFESAGASPGTFTQMVWEVDDIDQTVAALSRRGVVFEEVDVPGLKTIDAIAEIADNYASKGRGERAAWFRDSEGNVLAISQAMPIAESPARPSRRAGLSTASFAGSTHPIQSSRPLAMISTSFVLSSGGRSRLDSFEARPIAATTSLSDVLPRAH
jgi:predicted enzyme related to lactoylglutathione lyase